MSFHCNIWKCFEGSFFPFKIGVDCVEGDFGICRTNLDLEPTLRPQVIILMNKLLTLSGLFLLWLKRAHFKAKVWLEYLLVKLSCFSRFQAPYPFLSDFCSSLLLFSGFVSSRKQQQNQDSSQTVRSSDSLWDSGSEGGMFVLTASRTPSCCYLEILDKDLMGSKIFCYPGLL